MLLSQKRLASMDGEGVSFPGRPVGPERSLILISPAPVCNIRTSQAGFISCIIPQSSSAPSLEIQGPSQHHPVQDNAHRHPQPVLRMNIPFLISAFPAALRTCSCCHGARPCCMGHPVSPHHGSGIHLGKPVHSRRVGIALPDHKPGSCLRMHGNHP